LWSKPTLGAKLLGVIGKFGAKKSGNQLKPRNLQDFPVILTETGKATDDNHWQPPCTKSADAPVIFYRYQTVQHSAPPL
jgi:hypothetical protein